MTDDLTTTFPGAAGDGLTIESLTDNPRRTAGTTAAPQDPAARLAALGARAQDAWRDLVHHNFLGGECLFALAAALAEAREIGPTEQWETWARRWRLPRSATPRLLELHRVALNPNALEALGGPVLAEIWAAEARLPAKGEILAVTASDWQPDRPVPAAYIWRAPEAPGAFAVGLIDLPGPPAIDLITRLPLDRERDVWGTVWQVLGPRYLGPRYADVQFRRLPDREGYLAARLEARRQSAIKANARLLH